jgi:protein-ribulosamine 3-kinase
MATAVDPAIVAALKLDAENSKITSHGGSGFSSTFRLSGTKHGKSVSYFVKIGSGPDAEVMFRGQLT